MTKRKYFTTTLPYVNAKPHIAHAREFVLADVFARFYSQLGYETFLNIGTDEHGLKILRKAEEESKTVQEYCDEQVKHFENLAKVLQINYTNFIRTTDEDHIRAAQKFWKLCDEKGFIYKKNYKVKYCVGCELEKTDSELVDGKCPDHLNAELEEIEEENYFFKFSAFEAELLKFYEKNSDFVQPEGRFSEIKSLVKNGLQDFSISRLKSKMPWGIEVPGDETQVMYVWFDALVNYISTLGWPDDAENYEKWIPMVQFCGKDNLRQQTAMWQAMLMAAGLKNSEKVYVNGFIQSGGQKMSKSIGNVIDPLEMVERFGADATRFLLLSIGTFGLDIDVTWKKMYEKYNSDLANGIGNLTSRILTLYGKTDEEFELFEKESFYSENDKELMSNLEKGKVDLGIFRIMSLVRDCDKQIELEKPWELLKSDLNKYNSILESLVKSLFDIALALEPITPEVSEKIKNALKNKEKVMLFPRLENK